MEQVELPPVTIPQKVQINARKESNQSKTSNLSKNIIQQDIEMLEDEIKRLKKFSDSLGSVVKKVDVSRSQSQTSIDLLNKQSRQLQDQIQTYQKNLQQSSQKQSEKLIEANKKLYIAKWEDRISIASEVNIEVLKQIDIDDKKSLANQIFKWIVVAIYHQPQMKYYLPNFKAQLFQKDDGKDFKERLGKINAANARQQQIIKVKDFLSKYDDILKAQQLVQLQQIPKQAQKFKKIAQIYLQCNQLAKKCVQLQKSIESEKQNSLKRDEQAMKWKAKHQAVQQRLQVVQQYLYTLGVIEKQLESKVNTCQTKIGIAQQFLSNLKKGIEINTQDMEKYASL